MNFNIEFMKKKYINTMNYYNYISFYSFFIFILVHLFLEIESLTPGGRYGHSSVLLENKIYFFGGNKNYNSYSNEAFYLDVSQPFNIASPPLRDLPVMPIKSSWGTSSPSNANNEQNIYLFGGLSQDLINANISFTSQVYKFNLKSEKWDMPTINGIMPINRSEMRAIRDNSGRIYIFGGRYISNLASINYLNDMITFNVAESSWSINYPLNAPRIAGYSATLLSSGVIVYIGGYSNFSQNIDISEISLYDTNSSTWSVQMAKLAGQHIDNRDSHSAVLAPDGRIIIYGGSKLVSGNNVVSNFQANPNLAVLNTSTNPFEWTTPLVSSNIGVPSLTSHTADLVGNYMIVAYGNVTQPNAYPASTNPEIYIMDIRNYTWVNTFELSTNSTSISDTSDNRLIIGLGIAIGIIGIAILMIIGFFCYIRYQKNQREKREGEIMRIYGNNY